MADIETGQIGARLRERRLELKLTPEEVAAQTRIRKAYLLALEEERFEELPGEVYVVGFLQNYARVLGLPAAPLIEALGDSASDREKGDEQRSSLRRVSDVAPKRPRLLLLLLLVLLLAAIAGGVFWVLTQRHVPSPDEEVAPQEVVMPAGEAAADKTNAATPVESERPGTQEPTPVDGKETVADVVAESASVDISPALPAGGGMVKITVEGDGQFTVAVDGAAPRSYPAKKGQSISWQVKKRVDFAFDVGADVRLLVGGQEYTVRGDSRLQLRPDEERGE